MNSDLLLDDDLSWLPPIRDALHADWIGSTRIVSREGEPESLACSLYQAVNADAGHLSIACSLNTEVNQIETLLESTCFDDDPALFFRLYLFLLDEFTARMQEYWKLFGQNGQNSRQPEHICIWANHYAKHRTAIVIQHHGDHLFDDEPRNQKALERIREKCSVELIDTNWLKVNHWGASNQKNTLSQANDSVHIVFVPKFSLFLREAVEYYRNFIDYARANPRQIEQFQSQYHWNPFTVEEPESGI